MAPRQTQTLPSKGTCQYIIYNSKNEFPLRSPSIEAIEFFIADEEKDINDVANFMVWARNKLSAMGKVKDSNINKFRILIGDDETNIQEFCDFLGTEIKESNLAYEKEKKLLKKTRKTSPKKSKPKRIEYHNDDTNTN